MCDLTIAVFMWVSLCTGCALGVIVGYRFGKQDGGTQG